MITDELLKLIDLDNVQSKDLPPEVRNSINDSYKSILECLEKEIGRIDTYPSAQRVSNLSTAVNILLQIERGYICEHSI